MRPPSWDRPRATREELEAARQMTVEENLLAGGRLFDQECAVIRERIRELLPDASDKLVHVILLLAIERIHGKDSADT